MQSFPYSVVAFDLDGTLADTAPDLTDSLNHALVRLGRPMVPEDEVRHMVGHGARALLEKGLTMTGACNEALIEEGFPIFLEYYEGHIADRSRAYPGVEAALDQLAAKGVALAVCTNKLEGLGRAFLSAMGWTDRFVSVIGGDSLPVRKPNPAPLLQAIAQAGGGTAAFVGDSITDTMTGINAGIPTIAVSFGFSDRPVDQLGASLIIDHYDALVPALLQLAGSRPSSTPAAG